MNRYERHILDTPTAKRLMSFDACQVQFILRSELGTGHTPDECTTARITSKIAWHCWRRTYFRYSDSLRGGRTPLNPHLTERLVHHIWEKFKFQGWDAYRLAVGHYHY